MVPTEFVELPSRGGYYPEDHPFRNKEVVEIRHMTAKDEDILTSRSLLKKGLAIDRLIQSILVDKTVDTDSLLIGDKNAILVQTRIHAYGPTYDTRVLCPACSTSGTNSFNLMEVDLNHGDSWAEMNVEGPTENNTFLIKLPKSGLKQFVVSIDGHTDRTQLNQFIDNMPTLDAQYLRVAYNRVVPNVDMTLPYNCAECGTESRLEVPFTADFFWPNR